jgi:adenosylmethionine-8-amino-7-oxononanoate aminotransferase
VVALFDGFTLPAQPDAVAATLETLPILLAADLLAAIRTASPHVRLINQRVQEAIAQRYSTADEIKLLRTAPSAEMAAYNAYAEDCRAWGRAEKAKLGV